VKTFRTKDEGRGTKDEGGRQKITAPAFVREDRRGG
jgi:hypothetical protein